MIVLTKLVSYADAVNCVTCKLEYLSTFHTPSGRGRRVRFTKARSANHRSRSATAAAPGAASCATCC